MNAAACPNSKCNEPQYFQSNAISECQKCETKIDQEFIKTFNELIECTRTHLNSMKDIACMFTIRIFFLFFLFNIINILPILQ